MTNLDRTWKNCLRMWKWVSENLPEGFAGKNGKDRRGIVYLLKARWMKDHRYGQISEHCFFCEYNNEEYGEGGECGGCPGKLANPRFRSFWCQSKGMGWGVNPKAFYRRLVQLDKKRGK